MRRAWSLAVLLCGAALGAAAQTERIGCLDDDPALELVRAAAPDAAAREVQALVQAALQRSRAVGAARALAEAAARDTDETRAAAELQASLNARLGPDAARSNGHATTQLLQGSAGVALSQLLWDGGRQQALVDWRSQLAEAARLALLSQQEQIALSAVSLALESSRYRAQEQVYGQYVRKMACLVDGLSEVVAADRGRASELLQARKALQQAELARVGTESARRQADIRLQRLVGENAVDARLVGAALLPLPPLEAVLGAAMAASDVAQLERQVQAANHLTQALAAGTRPQLSWSLNGSQSIGRGGSAAAQQTTSLSAGLLLNVPLFNPGVAHSVQAAKWRALAAREQLGDLLESRRARVREVHEQARSSLDRAERVQRVLRDSQQLRSATQLQWQQLGRRSLFDVMGAESEHYNLRISLVNALIDAQQLNATLQSLGAGLAASVGR